MRRIFAFILAIVMTFSLSTVAFAAENEECRNADYGAYASCMVLSKYHRFWCSYMFRKQSHLYHKLYQRRRM